MKRLTKKFFRSYAAYYCLVLALIVAPFAGAVIIGSLPYTLTNGTTADATQVMANYQKIIDDCNANCAKSGANSDITALLGLTTPLAPTLGGTNHWYGGTSTGSANAQSVATLTPASSYTLTTGYEATFTAGFTNTNATTLALNGTTAKNVFKRTQSGIVALVGGEIMNANKYTVSYDGTQYVLLNEVLPDFGVVTTLASSGTTDLGTIPSHNVSITGTTSITAFGSSASTTHPVYRLGFTGALTLTHNGTSLILPGAANIQTEANATAEALYLGSGNWQVTNFQHQTPAPNAGQLQGVQYFVANGTWTRPAGVNSALFLCGGGGGAAGGNATSSAGNSSGGSGGGAGGWAQLYKTAPATTYSVTIPAAATGVSGAAGNNGGNVTIGAILTCNGGTGGGFRANSAAVGKVEGGAGGTASGGDLNVTGGEGNDTIFVPSSFIYGGGGGSNQLSSAGGNTAAADSAGFAGVAGLACGSGGTASIQGGTAGSARAGGDGGVGCVIAYSYY